MRKAVGLLLFAVLLNGCCNCDKSSDGERRTAAYLDSVRQQPPLLRAFLRRLPKGGDLHSHLSGAIYAESLIDFAAKDGLCVERATAFLVRAKACGPCDPKSATPAASCAYSDAALYNAMVDAWSMRNWNPAVESGHDHFFATFGKFSLATDKHVGDALAEVATRAAGDHVQYLELMYTPDTEPLKALVAKVSWNNDLARLREQWMKAGIQGLVAPAREQLSQEEAKANSLMKCDTPERAAGCGVRLRYLYQVGRGRPRAMVFAQILLGFELASADSRFVGLNLVMPEDCSVCMSDFGLHMQMLDYLHGVYPRVHISLHAGELVPALVPGGVLGAHIRDSVKLGHAERIGHGVDVMSEPNPADLMKEMADKHVLVEICLTSNDVILGVQGKDHPFSAYRHAGVPVTLATDDEGVSRSDMTHEYLRAVQSYGLSYADLKSLARRSLEHSFLPGASLWSDARKFQPVGDCADQNAGESALSPACTKFLDSSERAREQWKLEQEFAGFEKSF